MTHRSTTLAASLGLLLGLATVHPVLAQDGARWRERRAQMLSTAQKENGERRGNAAKAEPNARGMEGLPPKWLSGMRDMSPEDQQRFMQNNQRFQSLPPERQAQIRRNLEKWNNLSPAERDQMRERERVLEQMSPEQRQYVRNTLLPKWQEMPPERRQVINRHLGMLRNMTPAEQQTALNNPRFMQNMSPDEQSMLRDLNSLRNPPTQ